MPCSGDEDAVCGGPWANSVYIVGDPAEMTEEEKKVIIVYIHKHKCINKVIATVCFGQTAVVVHL